MNQTETAFKSLPHISKFCSRCIPLSFASADLWMTSDCLAVSLSKYFNRKPWPLELIASSGVDINRADDERIERIWQQKLSKASAEAVYLFNGTKFRFHSIKLISNSKLQLNMGITDYRFGITFNYINIKLCLIMFISRLPTKSFLNPV